MFQPNKLYTSSDPHLLEIVPKEYSTEEKIKEAKEAKMSRIRGDGCSESVGQGGGWSRRVDAQDQKGKEQRDEEWIVCAGCGVLCILN